MRRASLGVLLTSGAAVGLVGCASFLRELRQDLVLASAVISDSEIEITLKNSFIDAYKERATIEVPFTVDRADKNPHPQSWDGDLHVAGRAPRIGLPIVAEIENAASESEAVSRIHRLEAAGRSVRVAGAWRLWSEHGGKAEEVQGEALPIGELTNPDHVFEIHPITRLGEEDLRDSFHPVEGYRPAEAAAVFKSLENLPCRIAPGGATTKIVTSKHQFNDAEFILELEKDPQRVVEDGRFVKAAIRDLKGELLARDVRMVFVKGTAPDQIVKDLPPGARLHVFGLPRINLETIAWRAAHARNQPEALNRSLPYEILVVGVYPDPP
jgi:hypothetical protein